MTLSVSLHSECHRNLHESGMTSLRKLKEMSQIMRSLKFFKHGVEHMRLFVMILHIAMRLKATTSQPTMQSPYLYYCYATEKKACAIVSCDGPK